MNETSKIDGPMIQDAYHYALAAAGGILDGHESAFVGDRSYTPSGYLRRAASKARAAGLKVDVAATWSEGRTGRERVRIAAKELARAIRIAALKGGIDANTGEAPEDMDGIIPEPAGGWASVTDGWARRAPKLETVASRRIESSKGWDTSHLFPKRGGIHTAARWRDMHTIAVDLDEGTARELLALLASKGDALDDGLKDLLRSLRGCELDRVQKAGGS